MPRICGDQNRHYQEKKDHHIFVMMKSDALLFNDDSINFFVEYLMTLDGGSRDAVIFLRRLLSGLQD